MYYRLILPFLILNILLTIASDVPHCTHIDYHYQESSSEHGGKSKSSVVFKLDIGQTACFQLLPVDDNSTTFSASLHYLRYEAMEFQHSVDQHYYFAIPVINKKCVCECNAKSDVCSTDTHHTHATEHQEKLYPNYKYSFPQPSGAGCSAAGLICCDVEITPYDDKIIQAMNIDGKHTTAALNYQELEYANAKYKLLDQAPIKISTEETFHGSIKKSYMEPIEYKIHGDYYDSLPNGMYIAEVIDDKGGNRLRYINSKLINMANQYNIQELGWYKRKEDGNGFDIVDGSVLVKSKMKATAVDCDAQKMNFSFTASYFRDELHNTVNISNWELVEDKYNWIESVKILKDSKEHPRQVIVKAKKGRKLTVTLSVEEGKKIRIKNNSSRIDDFDGNIILDGKSRRFLNVTVFGATGRIFGSIQMSANEDSLKIFEFNLYVPSLKPSEPENHIIPIDAKVIKNQYVCMWAEGKRLNSKLNCKEFKYEEIPLVFDKATHRWGHHQGNCPGCNKAIASAIVDIINPLKWFGDFSNNPVEAILKTGGKIIFYAVVAVVGYIVLFRLLIPCCRCCLPLLKSSSLKRSHSPLVVTIPQYTKRPKYQKRNLIEDEEDYV